MNLLAIAVIVLAVGLVLFATDLLRRGSRAERIDRALHQAILGAREAKPETEKKRNSRQRMLDELSILGQRLEGSRIQTLLLAPEDRLLLEQVGWNHRNGTAAFLALRVIIASAFPILALLIFQPRGNNLLLMTVLTLGFGIILPKMALRNWAARLRKRASDELPLLIDLLRLLQGVGFSIDQSLQMLGDRLRVAIPLLGKEINEANIAYGRGRSREQSLRRMGDTYGDDDLHSLVQMIVQVHAHGGAMQEPLKQFGMRLREQRRMAMKEKVGKLAVKMTLVMMVTLLPALMMVLAGPAIISLAKTLAQMGNGA